MPFFSLWRSIMDIMDFYHVDLNELNALDGLSLEDPKTEVYGTSLSSLGLLSVATYDLIIAFRSTNVERNLQERKRWLGGDLHGEVTRFRCSAAILLPSFDRVLNAQLPSRGPPLPGAGSIISMTRELRA